MSGKPSPSSSTLSETPSESWTRIAAIVIQSYACGVPVCAACGHESAQPFKFCPECGAPLDDGEAASREVRKVVTVLFCDVVGYTAAGEQLDPEALRRLQARYFDQVRVALEHHGATLE